MTAGPAAAASPGRPPIWLLAALSGLGPLSLTTYVPAMPALAAAFAVEPGLIKLSYSLYLVGFGLGQLIYGPLSDALGRRPVLFAGLGIFVAGSIACVIATDPLALLLGRLAQGSGICAAAALPRAIVRDTSAPEDISRIMSMIALALGGVPAIAPLLGGYMDLWFGWRSVFALILTLGCALTVIAFLRLPETNLRPDRGALAPSGMLRAYRTALGHRIFVAYTAAIGLTLGGSFAFHSAGPFILVDQLGIPPHHYGWYASLMALAFLAGTTSSAFFTRRLGPGRFTLLGIAACVLGGLSFLAQTALGVLTAPGVTAAMCLWILGVGAVLPNAIAGAIAPFPHIAGAASALLGFFQIGLGAVAGFVVAQFDDGTAWPITITLNVMALAALVMVVALIPDQLRSRGPKADAGAAPPSRSAGPERPRG